MPALQPEGFAKSYWEDFPGDDNHHGRCSLPKLRGYTALQHISGYKIFVLLDSLLWIKSFYDEKTRLRRRTHQENLFLLAPAGANLQSLFWHRQVPNLFPDSWPSLFHHCQDIFNTERFIKKEKYIAPIVNIRYHNQYQTSTKEKGVDNP